MSELTYGVKIRVIKNVVDSAALLPKAGTVGRVINASKQMIVCEFETPYDLAGGGRALHDPEHGRGPDGRGVRVYCKADEIEVINEN